MISGRPTKVFAQPLYAFRILNFGTRL
jgi:hypothetical protein